MTSWAAQRAPTHWFCAIQDSYTVSEQLLYASPHAADFGYNLNYIRNSVNAVVDIYDGAVLLYVKNPEDPVLAAYGRAFALKDLNQLSVDLNAHRR